ncbi:MAG: pyridoxal-dependent decarboxylase [Gemmatimonadaceae bacterium]|nr:pyridoxal-dependent decarboxylase [Gemmatimonadaceae bacterium]
MTHALSDHTPRAADRDPDAPSAPHDALAAAFDPDHFRALAAPVVDRLAALLADARAETPSLPVLPWVAPGAQLANWPLALPERPDVARTPAAFDAMLARVLEGSTHLHDPGFVGHQVAPVLPLAALCELVAATLNNGSAVYEMGPVSTAMERHVIRWCCDTAGLPSGSGGVLTSGGTLATLTALLAARQARAGWDTWTHGAHDGPPLAILVSEQAHYCADRAVRIMGWGRDGAIRVPVDADHRMRPDALVAAHDEATARGVRVIGVVASACTTATGAFDPLEAIADICEARGLWLHVDGAHGASFLLGERHRHRLRGIERADSIVWDAHKMLMQPALVTAVLFRDERHGAAAFAQDASYLLADDPADTWWDLASRTFECTKRFMSLKLYATLACYGPALLGEYVTRTADLATRFATMLRDAPDFELAVEPQCNIVVFRHVPRDGTVRDDAALDALQPRLRQRVIEGGRFYPVQTRLDGRTWLRTTLMNPFTTDAHLAALLDAFRAAA